MNRTLISEQDIHYFAEGTHARLFDHLGARMAEFHGERGGYFAVWAPNAREVSVIGEFNGWQAGSHRLSSRDHSGIWEGFIPGLERGALYKYHIQSNVAGYSAAKADPYGLMHEAPPQTASVLWDLNYQWIDGEWMSGRPHRNWFNGAVSI